MKDRGHTPEVKDKTLPNAPTGGTGQSPEVPPPNDADAVWPDGVNGEALAVAFADAWEAMVDDRNPSGSDQEFAHRLVAGYLKHVGVAARVPPPTDTMVEAAAKRLCQLGDWQPQNPLYPGTLSRPRGGRIETARILARAALEGAARVPPPIIAAARKAVTAYFGAYANHERDSAMLDLQRAMKGEGVAAPVPPLSDHGVTYDVPPSCVVCKRVRDVDANGFCDECHGTPGWPPHFVCRDCGTEVTGVTVPPCPKCEGGMLVTLAARVPPPGENRALRKALLEHRADLHQGSSRPCPTCRESAEALGLTDPPSRCAPMDRSLRELREFIASQPEPTE